MLHDEHRDVDDVAAYLRRWLLVDDARARQMIRFLPSPLWRPQHQHVEGYHRLLRTWLDARPAGVSLAERSGLLDEPRSRVGPAPGDSLNQPPFLAPMCAIFVRNTPRSADENEHSWRTKGW